MTNQESTIIQINNITDFTSAKLVEFLNQKYNAKKSGKNFTLGDIQQYIRRGFLPKIYGDHPIERIKFDQVGISLIRVHFNIVRH